MVGKSKYSWFIIVTRVMKVVTRVRFLVRQPTVLLNRTCVRVVPLVIWGVHPRKMRASPQQIRADSQPWVRSHAVNPRFYRGPSIMVECRLRGYEYKFNCFRPSRWRGSQIWPSFWSSTIMGRVLRLFWCFLIVFLDLLLSHRKKLFYNVLFTLERLAQRLTRWAVSTTS